MPPRQSSSPPFPVKRKDLGDFEQLYQTRNHSPLRVAAFSACAAGTCLGAFVLSLAQGFDAGSDARNIAVTIVLVISILSLGCLLGGLFHKVKANRVALFCHGLAVEADGKVTEIRWEDVQHYLPAEREAPFRLSLRRGGELSILGETEGFVPLTTQIRARAGQFILEREFEKIVNFDAASFGPLRFTRDGLEYEGRRAAWEDLIKVASGNADGCETLSFTTNRLTGYCIEIPVAKIPSLGACKELIERLAPEQLRTNKRASAHGAGRR